MSRLGKWSRLPGYLSEESGHSCSLERAGDGSAQAARETSTLIDESLRVTADGGEHLRSVSGAVGSLTAQVGDLQSRMQSIVAASEEQTRGSEQIAAALMQMTAVVSDSTAGAEEEAAAAEELDAQAASMKQLVDGLMLRVGR